MELGILGCAYGTVITYFTNMVIVIVYCASREDLKESFFFPTRECFEGLWEYIKVGLPSSGMHSVEWWSYEIQAILASRIGIVEGGAMIIMINVLTVLTMIPLGASNTGAVFVGSSMGEGRPKQAKIYAALTVGYTFLVLSVLALLLEFF